MVISKNKSRGLHSLMKVANFGNPVTKMSKGQTSSKYMAKFFLSKNVAIADRHNDNKGYIVSIYEKRTNTAKIYFGMVKWDFTLLGLLINAAKAYAEKRGIESLEFRTNDTTSSVNGLNVLEDYAKLGLKIIPIVKTNGNLIRIITNRVEKENFV